MKLDNLCQIFEAFSFPNVGEQSHPERDAVLGVRSAVGSAVIDDEFLADCIALELRLIEADHLRRGLVPFFTIPRLGVQFAFGYWSPGGTPGPHEHTAWTITAVCRNKLEVLTYDRHESYRRGELVKKNHFEAAAGKVGFIYEPCIHEPRNTSSDWSLSLHVISPRDGERLFDHEDTLPSLRFAPRSYLADTEHPYSRVQIARQRERCVRQLARILSSMDVPRAPQLLAECFRLASSSTRRLIERIAPNSCQTHMYQSPWMLSRVHEQLVVSHRCEQGMVLLEVETADGRVEELVINDIAREAIEFAVKMPAFEISQLPGNLSEDEQTAIGEALEETGVFRRVQK